MELIRGVSGATLEPVAVSPDGTQVAYFEGEWLSVMPVAGGEPRKVARGSDVRGLAWTPDQRYLLVRRKGPEKTVAGPGDWWRARDDGPRDSFLPVERQANTGSRSSPNHLPGIGKPAVGALGARELPAQAPRVEVGSPATMSIARLSRHRVARCCGRRRRRSETRPAGARPLHAGSGGQPDDRREDRTRPAALLGPTCCLATAHARARPVTTLDASSRTDGRSPSASAARRAPAARPL